MDEGERGKKEEERVNTTAEEEGEGTAQISGGRGHSNWPTSRDRPETT